VANIHTRSAADERISKHAELTLIKQHNVIIGFFRITTPCPEKESGVFQAQLHQRLTDF